MKNEIATQQLRLETQMQLKLSKTSKIENVQCGVIKS